MLRVIVVDDEAPARRYLKRLLMPHHQVELVGEASSHGEAMRLIAEMRPDAAFMDVELGDGDGLDLWSCLLHPPLVVFVTAHADRAPRAFDVEAVDYLLKPVGAPRLAAAIDRLRRAHGARPDGRRAEAEAVHVPASPITDSVVIRSQGTTRIVKTRAISAMIANGDYVELRMADAKTDLLHMTLTRLAEQVPSPPFMRLSRSVMLNLDHIAKVSSGQAPQARATFTTRAIPVDLGRIAAMRLRKILAHASGSATS
jgi:two-component system LytT family response regulator